MFLAHFAAGFLLPRNVLAHVSDLWTLSVGHLLSLAAFSAERRIF